METASFTGLIKALVWILFIYYALKFVMRLLAPYFLQQVVKKAEENFQQQQQHYRNQQQQQPRNQQQSPHFEKPQEKKKVGEYIDFEEIE